MRRVRAWRYVDDARTHDVEAWIEVGDHKATYYVVRESEFGNKLPEDAYQDRHTIHDTWEATAHQAELEARLALLSKYHVHDSARPGWVPLTPRLAGRALAPDALKLPGGADTVEFHHYARSDAQRAVTLVGVAQQMPVGVRHMLARLDYRFPDVDGGNLRVVHSRLPAPVYRSVLAGLHLELVAMEYRKTGEGVRADPQGWAALRAALDAILSRLIHGKLAAPGAAPVRLPTEAELAIRASKGASSAARRYDLEDEHAGSATSVNGPKPAAMIDELDPSIFDALQNPKLLALHARWLAPGEGEALQAEGERAIRGHVNKLRPTVAKHEQHLLSLLEASLLVRAALKHRVRIDSETLGRIKHAAAWLGS